MEKAIEIKRRAQRCIQNGDLDGALAEYEKLVGFEDSDPYNFVLLADLLFKKGEQSEAAERYLAAIGAYEKASLYKNAIAVCKKMSRLSLSPAKVLKALANLHALDGLAGEAALYYVQYAEHMVRSSAPADAAVALRKAFDVCQDNIKVLEQLAEAWLLSGDQHQAAQALVEAAGHYQQRGQAMDENRCLKRASTLDASVAVPVADPAPAAAVAEAQPEPVAEPAPEPVAIEVEAPSPPAAPAEQPLEMVESARESVETPPARELEIERTSHSSATMARPDFADANDMEGFDSGRHHAGPSAKERVADAVAARPAEGAGASPDDFAVSESEIEAYGAVEMSHAGAAGAQDEAAGDETAFVIDEADTAGDLSLSDAEVPEDEESEDDPVYEISIDDEPATDGTGDEGEAEDEEQDDDVIVIEEDPEPVGASEAPVAAAAPAPAPAPTPAPGLTFGSPATSETLRPEPVAARAPEPAAAQHGPTTQEIGLQQVEALLTQAQEQFRSGDREQASGTLARAAQAYELLGRLDSAATIYRSLGRSASVQKSVLELWLGNCERRGDPQEAATVACEMGDRALNSGDDREARRWFERAVAFDAQNEIARRRLQRLGAGSASGNGPVAVASGSPPAPQMEAGRVEVAVGRGEAVTFDLSGLLSEFQRGVEAQLAGDEQSHYDLGMTYREMGLLEQAVESFRVAAGDERLAPRAFEMIGRCFADQARWPEAVGVFRHALKVPMAAGADGELRFYYARALVELGDPAAALAEYERVSEAMPGFEDVNEQIAALRRVLGRT